MSRRRRIVVAATAGTGDAATSGEHLTAAAATGGHSDAATLNNDPKSQNKKEALTMLRTRERLRTTGNNRMSLVPVFIALPRYMAALPAVGPVRKHTVRVLAPFIHHEF